MSTEKFRQILKDCYLRRSRDNSRYSLRAFARDLEMEPAQLSRVFQGKQNISAGKARSIADRLFDSDNEKNEFVFLVEAATARKVKEKVRALDKLEALAVKDPNLPVGKLEYLPNWFHIAILDLLAVKSIGPKDHKEVARSLGINLVEAKLALEALQVTGLVRKEGGRLVKAEKSLYTGSNIPSAAIRSLHKQFIQKAMDAVEGQSLSQRYFTTKTIAIAKAEIPKLRELIDEFSRRVSELSSSRGRKDSLYQVNVQSFQLDKEGNE